MHIMHILILRPLGKQFLDGVLSKQGTSQDAHHFVDVAVQVKIMLNDGHEAIGDDGSIYLYPDCVLSVSPEGLNPQVLLYPFEEQLDLPPVFVEERNVGGFQIEVVRVVNEGASQLRGIVDDAAYDSRIVSCVVLSCEPDGLVTQHVLLFKRVLSLYDLIYRLTLLTYDEEGIHLPNMKQSCQIPIAPVEDVAGQSLIRNLIHRIDIMYIGIRDGEERRNVRHYVYLCVQLDAGLPASESGPVEEFHAQVYRRGVESVESPVESELPPDTLVLGNTHHMEGKLLEHAVVAIHADAGKRTATDRFAAHPKVIGLCSMRRGDVCQFTHGTAACQLPEYESQQVSPRLGPPVLCYVRVLLHDSLELALWEKLHYLTEYVFACVHCDLNNYAVYGSCHNIHIFKSPTRFSRKKTRLHRHYRKKLNDFKRH